MSRREACSPRQPANLMSLVTVILCALAGCSTLHNSLRIDYTTPDKVPGLAWDAEDLIKKYAPSGRVLQSPPKRIDAELRNLLRAAFPEPVRVTCVTFQEGEKYTLLVNKPPDSTWSVYATSERYGLIWLEVFVYIFDAFPKHR